MESSAHQDRVAGAKAFWNDLTRRLGEGAPLDAYGTLTRRGEVVALRDELERAHVWRHLRLHPGARVLDLAGGAGRFALRIAPHVAHVTLVDLSDGLLEVARARAKAAAIENITFVQSAVQSFVPQGSYDVILIMGVALYLDDAELETLAERCANALAPGGQLLLKEPVTTDGLAREQRESDAALPYYARFRPREAYAEVFARRLSLRYQKPTLAHLIPWFVAGTEGAAQAAANPASAWLLARARPLLVRVDPWLLALELEMRARPWLAPLLADVPVVQDLYVFERAGRSDATVAASTTVELSVVVIAFNEEPCIGPVVNELVATLDAARIGYELVLVDDGSSDGTLAAMRTLTAASARVRVVALERNRGIGGALRAGFDAARGTHVTWLPADGQIPPQVVIDLYRRRREATMLTTVYRTRQDAWYRHVISGSLNRMIQLRTGQVAKSGGNYLFEREAWIACAPAADDSMMISTAFRHNLRRHDKTIVEVEIDCRARVAGSSKVLNPRTIWRTLDALGRIARDRNTR
jgi:SAM-dependent methyltransferase